MTYRISFSPEAKQDLIGLYLFIADRSGEDRALNYLERIEVFCRGFSEFPERGIRRDDLFRGLRIVGFERRISIAFHIAAETVTFDRILYGGRDIEASLRGRYAGPW